MSNPTPFVYELAAALDPSRCEMTVSGERCPARWQLAVWFRDEDGAKTVRALCAEHAAYADVTWPETTFEDSAPMTSGGYLVRLAVAGAPARLRYCPTPDATGRYVAAVRELAPAAGVTTEPAERPVLLVRDELQDLFVKGAAR